MELRTISIFNWNIANPSEIRATKQFEWLRKLDHDIFVLTETKDSKGCKLLKKLFEAYGFNVLMPVPIDGEYGVMIVSKLKMQSSSFSNDISFIQSRVVSVEVSNDPFANIEVVGVYIPSRDITIPKIERKQKFCDITIKALRNYLTLDQRNLIFCGDFNILEPNHIPYYRTFHDWEYHFYTELITLDLIDGFRHLNPKDLEYSWVGRTNDGYRYDHSFITKSLQQNLTSCYYFHEPRLSRLSDHSAIISIFTFKN